jgi:hypothetical protein
MAVTIANQVNNHRGFYAEVTGDGATTALVFTHNRGVHANTTATAFVVTSPTAVFERRSGRGGNFFPVDGTSATVASVVVTSTQVTVNTSAAVGNGTKAYVTVVFDQPSATL